MWNGTHPWDHVPGSLMLLEAGGSIGDFDGNAYQPLVPARGLIGAADEDTYRAVLAAMADAPPLRTPNSRCPARRRGARVDAPRAAAPSHEPAS
ncbi:inositol monophosphatase family protein [Ornithinimicrobium sp. INDO-MA30-4]|uniref:inositol monophosphatase family protein n=1 Tax=Ornithinimicrobium sp. INDO-MA30-4 TaxID=2908651 RepID=UPI001F42397D|nr:inositol monophosphatase family protein [Ornithinimicrobium sp. INDO-MA30-4]UJH71584.1 hypothetical protein L0A91_05290 [Ornithinimicrobium sp. INDO-MA30-4]